jgi:hypothetical protein
MMTPATGAEDGVLKFADHPPTLARGNARSYTPDETSSSLDSERAVRPLVIAEGDDAP